MILLTIVLPVLSILFSLAALTIGCVALAFVIGLKNSTHQVVWKPVETEKLDPFALTEDEEEEVFETNPNKRIKKEKPFEPYKNDLPQKEEPFLDLDNPNVTATEW